MVIDNVSRSDYQYRASGAVNHSFLEYFCQHIRDVEKPGVSSQ